MPIMRRQEKPLSENEFCYFSVTQRDYVGRREYYGNIKYQIHDWETGTGTLIHKRMPQDPAV